MSLDDQLWEQLAGGEKRGREGGEEEGGGVWGGRKVKRRKETEHDEYIYGNYDKYYGYRAIMSDPRVAALLTRREALCGKHWLDVGCNNGQLTSVLAARAGAASVTGIDIDERLITHAREIHAAAGGGAAGGPESPVPPEMQFATANIANERHNIPLPASGSFDVVLCLSVTKWIHLNFGDDGLRLSLQRVYDLLAPGGLLVLEPQPWKSYKKAATKISDKGLLARRGALQMRPDGFDAFLTGLGFVKVEHLLRCGENAQAKGFGRDLVLYRRGPAAGLSDVPPQADS